MTNGHKAIFGEPRTMAFDQSTQLDLTKSYLRDDEQILLYLDIMNNTANTLAMMHPEIDGRPLIKDKAAREKMQQTIVQCIDRIYALMQPVEPLNYPQADKPAVQIHGFWKTVNDAITNPDDRDTIACDLIDDELFEALHNLRFERNNVNLEWRLGRIGNKEHEQYMLDIERRDIQWRTKLMDKYSGNYTEITPNNNDTVHKLAKQLDTLTDRNLNLIVNAIQIKNVAEMYPFIFLGEGNGYRKFYALPTGKFEPYYGEGGYWSREEILKFLSAENTGDVTIKLKSELWPN